MNSKKSFWKSLSSEYVLDTKWLRVKKEVVEIPSGKIINDFYVVEGNELVAILAIDKDKNIMLVEQYRHAVKGVTIDLPGGSVDNGESPLEAAKRELAEEAGIIAGRWEKLLTYYPDSGRTACSKHIFLALDLSRNARDLYAKEDGEDIRLISKSFKNVLEEIRNEELNEPTLLIGIHAYLDRQ
jgi:8-oxo-dGTP pyrophosphatase MutT (NUDIX family)